MSSLADTGAPTSDDGCAATGVDESMDAGAQGRDDGSAARGGDEGVESMDVDFSAYGLRVEPILC